MEQVVNHIKEKLSTENLVKMMKDAKVIDNDRVKEDDVRKTLDKIDISDFINAEELAEKLNEITEEVAALDSDNNVTVVDGARPSLFAVLGQSKEKDADELPSNKRRDEDYMIQDNITAFLD